LNRTLRQRTLWNRTVATVVLALGTLSTSACPVCDTDTGRQVRAGIFNRDFGWTILSVVAPFPVLLGTAMLATHLLSGTNRRNTNE
jgi:hypothetical protein